MSICTISVLAPDFLTLPGWLCVPAKSIHLSLPASACQASRERQKTGTHSRRRSYAKRRKVEKVEKNVKTHGERMQRNRRESYLPQSFLNNCYLFNNFKWLKLSVCLSLWLQILTPGCFHSKCQQIAAGAFHSHAALCANQCCFLFAVSIPSLPVLLCEPQTFWI